MLLSGFFGPQIWSAPLVDYFPSLASHIPTNTTVRDCWVPLLIVAFFTGHLPECVANVRKARKAKGLPWMPLLLEWTPLVVFCSAIAAWLGSPHSSLLKENHLVLFAVTLSLVFGRMTTKIILAHLTRQPFPYWTVMLVPLIGGAVLVNLPYITGLVGITQDPVSAAVEIWYLKGFFIFAAIVYARWAVLVVSRICEYLGINCLTIPAERLEALRVQKNVGGLGAPNGNGLKGKAH